MKIVRCVFMDDTQHKTIIEIIAIEQNATPYRIASHQKHSQSN